MKNTSAGMFLWSSVLTVCAAACVDAPPVDAPPNVRQTMSPLQSSFGATEDVSISNHNGGNGVTDTTGELMVWNITGTDSYTEEALIRFGNVTIPAGSTVTGASLALTFDNWSTGFTVRGYYVTNPWHVTSSLGWLNRDPGLAWAAPGARGSGTDALASPTFAVSGFTGTGVEPKTIALDPAVVQGWITNPASNQGVLLINEATDAITRIYSSEDGTSSRRPQLTVTYATGGGAGCVSGAVGVWQNTAFSPGASPFTVTFDATPSASPTDAVVGLSLNAASAFTALAAIVRFNTGGTIDARNGGAYAAATTVPFAANTTYHFRLAVDVAAHVYSVFVTPNGGSEQLIGSNLAFRTEQASVASLDNWATTIDTDGQGTINVCNFTVTGAPPPPPPPPPSGQHPRIWLDPTTLSSLRTRAQAGAAAWTALRTACNSYLGGTVNAVGGDAYPGLPNIGEGYQGDGYFDPLMNVGVCYQIGVGLSPPDANTAAWGAKGADLLSKMALFTNYSRDDGYGIRFYGVGMALGFDFLYPALSSSVRSQVSTALNGWFSYYTTNGFGQGHPQGNYFAGYYAAKAYAGIATEDDNTNAPALWSDFLNRLHRGGATALSAPDGVHSGVQSYYARFMTGGGWPEGWGYGGLAVANMALPSLAAKTAKAIDLIQDAAAPFSYPLDNGMHLVQFSWPSRKMMDDRDILHESTNNPGTSFPAQPNPAAFTVTAAMLARWNHALAPQFHAFAREVRAAINALPAPWQEFLFWDDAAPEQTYTALPRSYLSSGVNAVAMRSDWTTSATWASFRATGYVDYGYAGEQYYDAGGLAIVKGGTPLLANATGALVTSYPGTIGAGLYESQVSDDVYGPSTRRLFNTFANGTGIQQQFRVDDASPPATRVTRFEDRNGYVQMRGENIQAVYTAAAGINGWTRDVIYLRPSLFVVYDRTSVASMSGDQHMSWHLFFTPASVPPPSAGASRYDVTNPSAGFLGAVTTVLPAGAATSLVNVFGSSKVYRLEVRPTTQATDLRWLTVFDASPSAAAVAVASALVSSANVKGVLLAAGGGNSAVLFGAGAAGTNVAGAVTFTEPAAASTKVVVTDLAPGTGYAVTAVASGANHNITVQPGAGFTTSANGTLYVTVAAGGTVTAGN
jgi:hypothetical protein